MGFQWCFIRFIGRKSKVKRWPYHPIAEWGLPLYKINFGVITLLPKEDSSRIEQYRPIYLLNVCFKVFTKVRTNCATVIAHKVVQPTKSAFIPRWNILERVVFSTKPFMKFIRKNMDGVLFKIVFKKAYDKIK
jgi:hypothetical protein